jgi:hypothetical protein
MFPAYRQTTDRQAQKDLQFRERWQAQHDGLEGDLKFLQNLGSNANLKNYFITHSLRSPTNLKIN